MNHDPTNENILPVYVYVHEYRCPDTHVQKSAERHLPGYY